MGNNSSKGELIPHKTTTSSGVAVKGGLIHTERLGTYSALEIESLYPSALSVKLSLEEGLAAHQLVGRVMAYQGDDG